MILRVLEKTGAMVQAHGKMYKAVDHLVLMYDSESWVLAEEMLKVL